MQQASLVAGVDMKVGDFSGGILWRLVSGTRRKVYVRVFVARRVESLVITTPKLYLVWYVLVHVSHECKRTIFYLHVH